MAPALPRPRGHTPFCSLLILTALTSCAAEHLSSGGSEGPEAYEEGGAGKTPLSDLVTHERNLGKGAFGSADLYSLRPPCAGWLVKKVIICFKEEFIRREIAAMFALKHPNLIMIFTALVARGDVGCVYPAWAPRRDAVLVMEAAPGGPITSAYFKLLGGWKGRFQALAGSRESRSSAKQRIVMMVLVDTLRGLRHMHALDYIHKDLKPANIWSVTTDPKCVQDLDCRFVLGDLGLAEKLLAKRTNNTSGTKFYQAPEVLNERYASKASDVWALGMSIAEMIGKWHKRLFTQQVQGHQKNFFKKDYIDEDLKQIVLRMTHGEEDQRPTASQALESAEALFLSLYGTSKDKGRTAIPDCVKSCEKQEDWSKCLV